jgi:hypothetical protein
MAKGCRRWSIQVSKGAVCGSKRRAGRNKAHAIVLPRSGPAGAACARRWPTFQGDLMPAVLITASAAILHSAQSRQQARAPWARHHHKPAIRAAAWKPGEADTYTMAASRSLSDDRLRRSLSAGDADKKRLRSLVARLGTVRRYVQVQCVTLGMDTASGRRSLPAP